MNIGSIQQVQSTQPPPAVHPGSSSGTQQSDGSTATRSFAETLAKIASEQMAVDALTGVGAKSNGANGFGVGSSSGTSASGGAQAEMNLISLLVSAGKSQGSASASSVGKASQVASVSGQDVVAAASEFSGTPYVWGGSSPKGFDCSGFTQYVYGELGISLPRTSEQQATVGTQVSSLKSAQPGDLVFFAGSDGTASAPGHVGIYVGNGKMIDSPYTGTTVQVQPVSSAGPVVAIRRVLPQTSSSRISLGNVKVPEPYVSTIERAANANGVPPSLLAALISQESGFNPSAVSSAGAQGIAQLMPSTASSLGVSSGDPTQAIDAAAKLIASYTSKFGSYANALAAYNAGPGAVEKYSGIPPYPETQAYVSNILSMSGLTKNGEVVK